MINKLLISRNSKAKLQEKFVKLFREAKKTVIKRISVLARYGNYENECKNIEDGFIEIRIASVCQYCFTYLAA